jgi:serine protease Do
VDAEAYKLDRIVGAEVNSVEEGSPAARAGLQVGDVVVALDGRPIENATELTSQLAQRKPGERVGLTVVRNGQPRDITAQLAEFEHPRDRTSARPTPDSPAARLGFDVAALTPQLAQRLGSEATSGVAITTVVPYSSAAMAGFRAGQVILSINGQEVKTPSDVERIASHLAAGGVVSVRVRDPQIGETIINYRVGS